VWMAWVTKPRRQGHIRRQDPPVSADGIQAPGGDYGRP